MSDTRETQQQGGYPTVEERLAELAALPFGWDSYGSEPPSEIALDVVRNMRITPTVNGGVAITFNPWGDEVEVEFDALGRVDSVCFDRDKGSGKRSTPTSGEGR